jgi:hypothetical protein
VRGEWFRAALTLKEKPRRSGAKLMKERNVGTLQLELGLWQWRKETGRAYPVVLLARVR